MNRKGQALVEFVLILPIFILILFSVYDIGMIIYNKNVLESTSNDVILMLTNDSDIDEIKSKYNDITIVINDDGKYYNITLNKKIDILTPGLNLVLGSPYNVEVERVIKSCTIYYDYSNTTSYYGICL